MRASVQVQQAEAIEREMARLEMARGRMRLTPADVLAALGLDVEAAVWAPERGGQAHVPGACVWQGVTLTTELWAEATSNGRVSIHVEGHSANALAPDVRAAVGRMLGWALQGRVEERAKQVRSMLNKAETWSLGGGDLANRNLTLEVLPFLAPVELAAIRQTVARRTWEARCKRIAERRAAEERRTAQYERALELRAEIEAWQRAQDEFAELACSWAQKWAALFDDRYGTTELWEVTFGARGEGRVLRDEDEPGLWLKAVVLEAPGDLAVSEHGLTRVTAVSWNGATEEMWIGPVAKVRPVTVTVTVTAGAAYHRTVRCDRFVVNVPAVASDVEVATVEKDAPQAPPTLQEWLRATGFEREVETAAYLVEEGAGDEEDVALTAVRRNWREG
jgi:hypothetical protein